MGITCCCNATPHLFCCGGLGWLLRRDISCKNVVKIPWWSVLLLVTRSRNFHHMLVSILLLSTHSCFPGHTHLFLYFVSNIIIILRVGKKNNKKKTSESPTYLYPRLSSHASGCHQTRWHFVEISRRLFSLVGLCLLTSLVLFEWTQHLAPRLETAATCFGLCFTLLWPHLYWFQFCPCETLLPHSRWSAQYVRLPLILARSQPTCTFLASEIPFDITLPGHAW